MNKAVESPYPGPRPFQQDETEFFFGRECEQRDLYSLVLAHNAVLLYAQSGTGKTSLVNAGLIPLLRNDSFHVLPPVRVFAAAPDTTAGDIGNVFTYNIARRWLSDPCETLEHMTLKETFERASRTADAAELRVMVFDQFEELFTTHLDRWRDRKPFFEQLDELLEEDPSSRALFVLREDHLAQIEPLGKLLTKQLRARMRLERLGGDAALAAITEPLAKRGRAFENGVAEELVADLMKTRVEIAPGRTAEVVGEYVEPVQLQLVCASLWQALGTETRIRRKHVRALGNIDRILSGFYEEAVAAAAERSGLLELDIRTWCEKNLITSMGTRGTVCREPETTGHIPNSAVDELEERHLIRAEWRAGARWYELTHDRFIEPICTSNRLFFESQAQYADDFAIYELITQAHQAWQLKRMGEAEKLFAHAYRALDEDTAPQLKAYVFYLFGSFCADGKRNDEAVPLLELAADLYLRLGRYDDLSATIERLAWIAHDSQDYDRGIALLTSAIRLTPDRENLYELRGGCYWYSGKLKEAIADYDTVLERQADNANAYSCRGQIFMELNEFAKAIADLDQVIVNADRADGRVVAYALNGRGRAHGGLRQWTRAEADFDASMMIAPNNAWVFFNRAVVHHWRGNEEQAAADLQTSLQKSDPPLNPLKRSQAEAILSGRGRWPS